MDNSLQPRLGQAQHLGLKQEIRLAQAVDFANTLTIPDEVLSGVITAMTYNPDLVEKVLQENKKKNGKSGQNAGKIGVIYGSLVSPSKEISHNLTRGGIIISPDISVLEKCLEGNRTNVTPDVTYIGRKNDRPEIVFSDHLKGSMALRMLQIDPIVHSETSKLVAQLQRFDVWKREKLRESYGVIGSEQRTFLESLDSSMYCKFDQNDLSKRLDLHSGTVSRLLSNRWVEARNVKGEQKFLNAKDLLITKAEFKKYLVLPDLNKVLKEEFEKKKAYSDPEITEKVGKYGRRCITNYRKESNIPSALEREKQYKTGTRAEPYVFS